MVWRGHRTLVTKTIRHEKWLGLLSNLGPPELIADTYQRMSQVSASSNEKQVRCASDLETKDMNFFTLAQSTMIAIVDQGSG